MGVGWVLCPRGNKIWILHDFENDLKDPIENVHHFPLPREEKEIKVQFTIRRNRGFENMVQSPPLTPMTYDTKP